MDPLLDSGKSNKLDRISARWRETEDLETQNNVLEQLSSYLKLSMSRLQGPAKQYEDKGHETHLTNGLHHENTRRLQKLDLNGKSKVLNGDGKISAVQEDVAPKIHSWNPSIELKGQGSQRHDGSVKLEDILEIGDTKVKMEDVIRVFDKDIVCSGVYWSHPTFFGLVPGSGHLLHSAGEFLACVSHIMSSARFTNSAACEVEASVIRWVCDFVGFPEEARGVTVSGTSMASLLAFATACHMKIKNSQAFHKSVVYLTCLTHSCNMRALRLVGLSDVILREVPIQDYRMDVRKLDEMITADKKAGLLPFLVIGTMGTTSLGSVDPLGEIGDVARKHAIWYHVDAAIGCPLLLDETVHKRYEGVNKADSMTMDFHKGLSAPLGTGALLVRDGDTLRRAMARDSEPFIAGTSKKPLYAPLEYGVEFTRPFRAFPVWFMLKIVGSEMVKTAMTEKITLTDYAYKSLNAMPNIVTCMKPDLTVIAFRYVPPGEENGNDVTQQLHRLIAEEGKVCLTPTIVDGFFYIRLCIFSFRSHIEHVDAALSSIKNNLDIIEGKFPAKVPLKTLIKFYEGIYSM